MYKSKLLAAIFLLVATVVQGQSSAPPAPAPADSKPPLKPEELEQLLAPIALYPDSLLTQMLMASTYPLEIVEADRWAKANKNLQGDALAKELEKQSWDPSVKSMVNFPDQLSVMSEKLDITMKIGDAFIDQQADVMNTIQVLRGKAQQSGNLKSDQQVTVEAAPAPAPEVVQGAAPQVTVVQAPPQVITIASASPTVVYVPTYEPTVVYGAWPYPPPPPYYPPRPAGYIAGAAISFGVGVACGAAWGYAWGHSDWGHNDVKINVNQNVNFNTNIDRSKYQNNINARQNNINGGGAGNWQHDSSHRQGVPYRNQADAQKFGGANQAKAAQAREQFRGQTNNGTQIPARSDDGRGRGASQGGNLGGQTRDPGARGNRGATPDRGGAQNRPAAGAGSQNRAGGNSSGTRSGAFDGANRSGSEARADSQRGQTSRSGGGASRSGGGARTGGGAARTGGRR